MSGVIPCSVLVLTRDAGATLAACLEGMRRMAQVIVLDAGSTDGTREIAASFHNVTLLDQPREFLDPERRIRDFAAVRNAGLAAATQPWLMFVDADEVMTPTLLTSIEAACRAGTHDAYQVFRRFVVGPDAILRAAAYPALHVRLVRRSATAGFHKPVHERFQLAPGARVSLLAGDLLLPLPPARSLWPKYRRYIAIEAERAAALRIGAWFTWIFFRGVRSFVSYALRLAAVWLVPGRGKRLPIAYELQFLAYPLVLIIETSPLHRWKVGQFLTYLVTGGTATLLNVGAYALLLWLGMWYVGASVASEVLGFIAAFLLHKHVAFRSGGSHVRHFARYCLLGLWNLVASTLLLWMFVEWLGVAPLTGKMLVIACMVSWNFVLYKWVVYR